MRIASRLLVALLTLTIFTSVVASAGRDDATEYTLTLEEDDYEIESLWTEVGTPVEIWIEAIESHNGSTPHALDVYITSSDEWWDHFCGGEGNQFADAFEPVYTKETLTLSELPYHIEWTPETDDSFYVLIDNCDNQRTTDYKDDVSAVKVTLAIDDQTNEAAEGFLAFMGGSLLLCCGGPICFAIIVVVLLVMILRKKNDPVMMHDSGAIPMVGAPATTVPGAVPMVGAPAAAQPAFDPTPVAPPAAAVQPMIAAPNPGQEYYDGLIQQGYTPDQAANYTRQHYPGFEC